MKTQTTGMSADAIAEVADMKAHAWFIATPADELLFFAEENNIRLDMAGNFYKSMIDAKTAELINVAKTTGFM